MPDSVDETVALYRYWAKLHSALVPFFYSLARAGPKHIVERLAGRIGRRALGEAQLDHGRLARRHGEPVVRRRLRPRPGRVDRVRAAVDHVVVDPVLHVSVLVRDAEQTLGVRLVLAEEERRLARRDQEPLPEAVVRGEDRAAPDIGDVR